ncbi:MAG TPA: amino acid-binding ACT [Gemmataceae bacterium]|nr:amino acid-binding ACT [Gemmataceae bacterium]
MALKVDKVAVWTGEIEDRAGGLAAKLGPLADAGADFDFVIARRQPHLPGKGVVFLGPVSGAKQKKAAADVGLAEATDVVALRVEGTDKPGAVYQICRQLADAGINLRGLSAGTVGTRFVAFLGFDNAADADKAAKLLRAGEGKKR